MKACLLMTSCFVAGTLSLEGVITTILSSDFSGAAIEEDFEASSFATLPNTVGGVTYDAGFGMDWSGNYTLFPTTSDSFTIEWSSSQEKFGLDLVFTSATSTLTFLSGGLSGTLVGSTNLSASTGWRYFESSTAFDAISLSPDTGGSAAVGDVIFQAVPEPSNYAALLGIGAALVILFRKPTHRD